MAVSTSSLKFVVKALASPGTSEPRRNTPI